MYTIFKTNNSSVELEVSSPGSSGRKQVAHDGSIRILHFLFMPSCNDIFASLLFLASSSCLFSVLVKIHQKEWMNMRRKVLWFLGASLTSHTLLTTCSSLGVTFFFLFLYFAWVHVDPHWSQLCISHLYISFVVSYHNWWGGVESLLVLVSFMP